MFNTGGRRSHHFKKNCIHSFILGQTTLSTRLGAKVTKGSGFAGNRGEDAFGPLAPRESKRAWGRLILAISPKLSSFPLLLRQSLPCFGFWGRMNEEKMCRYRTIENKTTIPHPSR